MRTSAGKLADSESSEAANEEDDPTSLEGSFQDHLKTLKNKIRQFEAGYMTACDNLMEEKENVVELNTRKYPTFRLTASSGIWHSTNELNTSLGLLVLAGAIWKKNKKITNFLMPDKTAS